jgi:hypothetical protein
MCEYKLMPGSIIAEANGLMRLGAGETSNILSGVVYPTSYAYKHWGQITVHTLVL